MQIQLAQAAVVVLPERNIFDIVDGLTSATTETIRGVAIVVALVVVVTTMLVTKMAIGRVLMTTLGAAIALYIVFNITEAPKIAEDTINLAPASAVVSGQGS